MPTNQFIIYDQRLVQVESVSAELSINQSREIALYLRAFDRLAEQAEFGTSAAAIITRTIGALRPGEADLNADDAGQTAANEAP